MEKEIWKQVKGFEDYEISNLGNIRSYNKTSDKHIHKTIKINHTKEGYEVITLSKTRKYLIHRLVAETFIDNPDNKKEVNHKDLNKSNNKVSNLEWVSHSENMKHAYVNGVVKMPEGGKKTQWKRVLTDEQVREIRNTYIPHDKNFGMKALAKKYGVSESVIKKVANRVSYRDVE